MIAGLIIFLSLSAARADYLNYIFLEQPEISGQPDGGRYEDLKPVCTEIMKYNYFEEVQNLRLYKKEFDKAVQEPITTDQAILIEKLKSKIRQTTEHLIYLSKPEWNKENVTYKIRWWLPQEFSPSEIEAVGMNVPYASYKGEVDGDVIEDLSRSSDDIKESSLFPADPKPRTYFEYKKRGTFLEFCQFAPTLEFEVELLYTVDFPVKFPFPKMFYLRSRPL